jgi:hypothetical protein
LVQDDPMATAETSTNQAEDMEKLREEWLERLSGLVETVRGWAQDLDWSTRRIEKKMEDSRLGTYKAPALLLQKELLANSRPPPISLRLGKLGSPGGR